MARNNKSKFVTVNGVKIRKGKTLAQLMDQQGRIYGLKRALESQIVRTAWERGGRVVDHNDLSTKFNTITKRHARANAAIDEVGMRNFLDGPLDSDSNLSVGALYAFVAKGNSNS